MRKALTIIIMLSLAIIAGAFTCAKSGCLFRNGQPYRFVGTNLWYAPILASTGQGGDRQRLSQELDSLCAMGVTNLRVLVGADGPRGMRTKVEPTLQEAPGVYNDTLLDGLDYFMAEAARRDMQVVLYLNNSWEWSGGYGYYLEQANEPPAPLSDEVSWADYCRYYARFSLNRYAQLLFLAHVRFIVGRVNRYTHRPYAADPALMAWQVGNEPRAFTAAAKDGFAAWVSEAAALIRALDPNHLISIGSEGIIGCENDAALYRRLCADPNIDVLNLHIWPSNWGWADKAPRPGDLERSISESKAYIAAHVAIARELGKPLVIEEFGYPRDGGSRTVGSPTRERDEYYKFILSQLDTAEAEGSPLCGVNFWAWAGAARPLHASWLPGDDYTGDPAHEPQGLYSVFNNDTTTIRLLRAAAR